MSFPALVDAFAVAVQGGRWPGAMEALQRLLADPEVAAPNGLAGVAAGPLRDACTRFTAAWGGLFASEAWTLEGAHLRRVLPVLHRVHAMVHAGSPGSLDNWLMQYNAARGGRHDGASYTRMALLWVPNSVTSFQPFANLAASRHVVAAQAVATVGDLTLCTPQADRARHTAIELLLSGSVTVDDLAPVTGGYSFLGAWMRCSYATHPRRHAVKTLLNAALHALLADRIRESSAQELRAAAMHCVDGKPVMVIPLELAWGTNGAMRRCYGEVVRALRGSFHTIAVGGPAGVVEDGLFDGQIAGNAQVPAIADVCAMADAIRARQPAIVFFPSVGMDITSIVLANFRLAPLQVMALGHPATSHSPVMDVVLHEAGYLGDHACYGERVVEVPPGTIHFSRPLAGAPRHAVDPDAPLRIAVPAVAQKISWPLLDVLRRLETRIGRALEVRFFTGLNGISWLEAHVQIAASLKSARVFPSLGYGIYMEKLAECDLHLASFPFGGTNSVIDAFHLGVPVLSLRGPEPHESVDAELVTRAGLADALVARDVDDLLEKLVRFANDADWRAEVSARMRAAIASGDFLGRGDPGVYCERFEELLAETRAKTAAS